MCPPSSQGTCLDIVSAYHNSLLLPAHKAYVVSMWQGLIYVDHCTMEGLSSAGNIQGALTDALIKIFKARSIPRVLKWVDDFVFFCTPKPSESPSPTDLQYSYDITTILS